MKSPRALLTGLLVAGSTVAALAFGAHWILDPEGVKARVIAEVEHATGRTMTISGPVRFGFSLTPSITIDDVALANPSGFSRPDMVRVARIDVRFRIAPLFHHRIEIDHVTLEHPDFQLEMDPSGHANWVFAREPPPGPMAALPLSPERPTPEGPTSGTPATEPPTPGAPTTETPTTGTPTTQPPAIPPPAQVTPPKQRFAVTFGDFGVTDAHLGWLDGRSGRQEDATAPRLALTTTDDGSFRFSGTVVRSDRTVNLTGQVGPERDADGQLTWPMLFRLESGGASASAAGQISRPRELHDYAVVLTGDLTNPAAFLPGLPTVPLRAVSLRAAIRPSGGAFPSVLALEARVGSVDLETVSHGMRLENLSLSTRTASPIEVSARLLAPGLDSTIGGQIGDFGWLKRGASGPVAFHLGWNAGAARAGAAGIVMVPPRLSGITMDVAAEIPDPALIWDRAPPALKSVVFRARLTDLPGPMPFRLISSAGDLSGELSVSRTPRLTVEGQVSSHRLDLDALRLAPFAAPPVASPADTQGGAASDRVASQATRPAASTSGSLGGAAAERPDAGSRPRVADKPARLIPDTKLPFDLLHTTNADIRLAFAQLRVGGNDVTVNGTVSVKDGLLRLDKFAATGPDRPLTLQLTADASKTPPPVHLTVDAPGLALGPVLMAFGLPQAATGSMDVHADLTAEGDTPRALAGSLGGWAGVALSEGKLDARMVNGWLEQLRPLRIEGADVTDLRCFALRADAKAGTVTIQPLAFNTPALIVEGGGDLDLGQETLALRLRPRVKVSGTGVAVPLRIGGTLSVPSAKVDLSLGKGTALAGLLLGVKDVMGAGGGGDPCPAALVRARFTGPSSAEAPK